MKTKRGNVKAKQKAKKVVEKDDWGFRKGSKSSVACKLLASGKATTRDVRKKFASLSFFRLLKSIEKNGFKVAEDAQGLCSVIVKATRGNRVRQAKPPVEKVAPGSTT